MNIEFHLVLKRIDFIISGIDKNSKENIVIIELKQWEKVEEVTDEDALVKTFINKALVKNSTPFISSMDL